MKQIKSHMWPSLLCFCCTDDKFGIILVKMVHDFALARGVKLHTFNSTKTKSFMDFFLEVCRVKELVCISNFKK